MFQTFLLCFLARIPTVSIGAFGGLSELARTFGPSCSKLFTSSELPLHLLVLDGKLLTLG